MQLQLRRMRPVGSDNVGIYHRRYVQHHVVVCFVLIMSMGVPVGRFLVYLHISHPHHAADFHLGIEEVGTVVAVVQTGVYHLHEASVGGVQLVERQDAVFPDVVKKDFHKRFSQKVPAVPRCSP